MNLIIRKVTKNDTVAILNLYTPFITDTAISFEIEVPTVEAFAKRIAKISADYPYLVCEIDSQIIAFAYASKHREREAYRYSADVSIYISPQFHGQGIGKKLYTQLFKLLKTQGIYTAYAGITLPNEKSIGLHKSFDFVEIGTYHSVGYKLGKWHDVVWLEKPLRKYDNLNK